MPIAQHTRGQRLDADALAAVMGGAAPQPEAGRPPAAAPAATPEAGEPAAFGAQDALSDAVAARLALARAMVPVVEAISPPRFAFWRDRTALAASVAERLMATATRLAEDAAPDEEGPAARRIALGALLGHAGRAYAAAHNAEAAKAVRKLSALAPDARQATQRRHEAAVGIDMAPVWAEFDRRMGCIAAALAVTATPEADRRARP